MSTAPARSLTDAEYLARERKAAHKSEFYRGEVFAMAGASRAHNLIAGNCFGLLWQQLSKRECEVYQAEMKVRIAPGGLYAYPDVVVACGDLSFADDEKDVLLNPIAIVEVLSDSTADYDRGFKGTQYRNLPSLRTLLLVEQDQALVELYSRQGADTWLLKTIVGRDSIVELAAVSASLRLADIFAQVEFPDRPRLAVHPAPDARP